MNHTKKIYLLVALVGVLSLAIRLWMLDKHWINPDEGAHLMDAILALSGKIPMVDYDSRQPLYTYSLAGVLHIFGHGFETGRLLSCICSFLTGMVVFLLGKVLFDEKTAAVAAVIYFILPLEFMNSTMVKTEPLTVLLTCTSFLALSRSPQQTQQLVDPFGYYRCFMLLCTAIRHHHTGSGRHCFHIRHIHTPHWHENQAYRILYPGLCSYRPHDHRALPACGWI